MTDPRILVLADDLTGAVEVGSKFAAAGVRSQVRTWPDISPGVLRDATGVFVVDTETRHVGGREAAGRVYEFGRLAYDVGYSYVYKKTDSTLRGNIGAELAALIKAYSGSPLLYVPAYPQMGRTVINGSLYVNGVLVSSSCFAGDLLNPVQESHIPTLLAAQCRLRIQSKAVEDLGHSEPWGIAICDGETDADVEAAAKAFVACSTFKLAAGPAAFASHLVRLVGKTSSSPVMPSASNTLIVNGSLHKVSVRQVQQAKHDGFKSIYRGPIPAAPIEGAWTIFQPVSSTSRAPLLFAKSLAKSVCKLVARSAIDALVVFGGDTAYAIVEAMGNPPLHPLGEAMEGIPISRIEASRLGPYIGPRDRDLHLITKAGGFGGPDVLTFLRNALGRKQQP